MSKTGSDFRSLAELAERLTELQDRDRYASLICYFNSLPQSDELFRLAELLGFITLIVQRVPDAMAGLVVELKEIANAAASYHTALGDRLAKLPQEITEGVDVSAIAKAMAESVRQLAWTELKDTAAGLNVTAAELRLLTANTTAALKPLAQQYKGLSGTISTELGKFMELCLELRQQTARLIADHRSNLRIIQCLRAVLIFLAGVLVRFWSH